MIQTEQTVLIDVGLDEVWDYVRDMRRWAGMMPGMQAYDLIDEDNSRWTLKVGVGGLVRTVKVLVHVDRWDGPGRVDFSYKLEGDPVEGAGAYTAVAKDQHQTEVTLQVRVQGGGPMAPMWEAMGGPVLPQLAKAFAGQLKSEIEKAAAATPPPASAEDVPKAAPGGLLGWLRSIWRALFGPRARA